jgi:hypothetical protein
LPAPSLAMPIGWMKWAAAPTPSAPSVRPMAPASVVTARVAMTILRIVSL